MEARRPTLWRITWPSPRLLHSLAHLLLWQSVAALHTYTIPADTIPLAQPTRVQSKRAQHLAKSGARRRVNGLDATSTDTGKLTPEEALSNVRAMVEQRLQMGCALKIVNGTVIGPLAETGHSVNRSHPMLCQVKMTPQGQPPDESRTVILIAVDQLREPGLVRTGHGGKTKRSAPFKSSTMKAWPTLLNQAAYAFATRRRMYMWAGDALLLGGPSPVRKLHMPIMHEDNASTWLGASASHGDFEQKCTEPADATPMYHARVLGMLALLLLEKPNVNTVLYLDTDVWFSDAAWRGGCCLLEAYGALAPRADIIGAGNHYLRPNGVWLNSGVMMWRRSAWTHRMLSMWWLTRCGWNDQTALYVILFAGWQAETAGRVSIASNKLQSWGACMKYALGAVRTHLENGHFPPSWSPRWRNRTDLWVRSGGRRAQNPCCSLARPLELPHLLVLPLQDVPRDHAGPGATDSTDVLPGFVGNQDPKGCVFLCHTKVAWADRDSTSAVDPATRPTKGGEDPDYAFAAALGNRCKCRGSDVCANGKCAARKLS